MADTCHSEMEGVGPNKVKHENRKLGYLLLSVCESCFRGQLVQCQITVFTLPGQSCINYFSSPVEVRRWLVGTKECVYVCWCVVLTWQCVCVCV